MLSAFMAVKTACFEHSGFFKVKEKGVKKIEEKKI